MPAHANRVSVACLFMFLFLFQGATVEVKAQEAELVWVVKRNTGTVAVIDPDSRGVIDVVDPPRGELGEKITAGEGGVWVTYFDGHVHRLDPRSRTVVASLQPTTFARSIAAGNGAVWMGNGDLRQVTRIDPATNTVVGRIETEFPIYDVAMTGRSVWVATSQGQIHRFAATASSVSATIETDGEPNALAGGSDDLWASDLYAGRVLRVSAAGTVVPIDVGFQTGEGPDLVVGLGSVWVATAENNVVIRIEENSNEVLATIDVGGWVDDVAVGAGAVWAVLPDDAVVVRIDPATNAVSDRVPVAGFPSAIAVSR
jgi:streptogramin lyase